MAQETSRDPRHLAARNLAVVLPSASNAVILELPVDGLTSIGVQVDVTVRALDAFIIKGKFHASGAFVTLYSAAVDYTSPAGLLIGASGDLTAQGAATTGWFTMDVRGLYAVQVLASGTVDETGRADVFAGGS